MWFLQRLWNCGIVEVLKRENVFFFFGGSLATRELSKNVFYFLLSSTILSTELVFFLPVARDVNSLTDPSHSRRQRTRGNFGF